MFSIQMRGWESICYYYIEYLLSGTSEELTNHFFHYNDEHEYPLICINCLNIMKRETNSVKRK